MRNQKDFGIAAAGWTYHIRALCYTAAPDCISSLSVRQQEIGTFFTVWVATHASPAQVYGGLGAFRARKHPFPAHSNRSFLVAST